MCESCKKSRVKVVVSPEQAYYDMTCPFTSRTTNNKTSRLRLPT